MSCILILKRLRNKLLHVSGDIIKFDSLQLRHSCLTHIQLDLYMSNPNFLLKVVRVRNFFAQKNQCEQVVRNLGILITSIIILLVFYVA